MWFIFCDIDWVIDSDIDCVSMSKFFWVCQKDSYCVIQCDFLSNYNNNLVIVYDCIKYSIKVSNFHKHYESVTIFVSVSMSKSVKVIL